MANLNDQHINAIQQVFDMIDAVSSPLRFLFSPILTMTVSPSRKNKNSPRSSLPRPHSPLSFHLLSSVYLYPSPPSFTTTAFFPSSLPLSVSTLARPHSPRWLSFLPFFFLPNLSKDNNQLLENVDFVKAFGSQTNADEFWDKILIGQVVEFLQTGFNQALCWAT